MNNSLNSQFWVKKYESHGTFIEMISRRRGLGTAMAELLAQICGFHPALERESLGSCKLGQIRLNLVDKCAGGCKLNGLDTKLTKLLESLCLASNSKPYLGRDEYCEKRKGRMWVLVVYEIEMRSVLDPPLC